MTKEYPLELKDVVSPEILDEINDLRKCPECGAVGSSTDFAATQKIVEINIKRFRAKSREKCFRSARLNPDCPTCSSFEKKPLEQSLAEFFDNATEGWTGFGRENLSLGKFADALVELNPIKSDHLFFYLKCALMDREACEYEELHGKEPE